MIHDIALYYLSFSLKGSAIHFMGTAESIMCAGQILTDLGETTCVHTIEDQLISTAGIAGSTSKSRLTKQTSSVQ